MFFNEIFLLDGTIFDRKLLEMTKNYHKNNYSQRATVSSILHAKLKTKKRNK
jgi:hypothetical protein